MEEARIVTRVFDRSFDGASFDAHESPIRCCLAVPLSSDCQTVADTRRVVGSCWLCGAHRARAAAAKEKKFKKKSVWADRWAEGEGKGGV